MNFNRRAVSTGEKTVMPYFAPFFRLRLAVRFLPLFFLVALLNLLAVHPVAAQLPTRIVPTPHYFDISMYEFNRGEFAKALAEFNLDLRNMVQTPDANGVMRPWVDAMCYTIMCGECQYQLGRYDEAMTLFNNAVQIYINNADWLANITYTNNPVMIPRPALPWGSTTRKGGLGDFRNCKFQVIQEHVNIIDLRQQGVGLARQQQLTTIHANEIIMRLALLVRRRGEILGPLAKYDPMTKELTQIFGGRPCPPNHFSGVWVDVLYGLSLAAMGDDAQALVQLEKGLSMQAMFDHQLTPYALNELGHIALRSGKPADAVKYYFEASLCATYFADWALLGETFRNMADAQRLVDRTKPLPVFAPALAHFQNNVKNPSPLVVVPACHETAEYALMAGDFKTALNWCNQAAGLMTKRSIAETVHGARNHYLRAMLSYMAAYADAKSGKPLNLKTGDDHLAASLTFLRRGSLWLYQLGGLETLFQQGAITARGPITMRIADELYENLLRDPTSVDWSVRPMDCLAQMTFAPPTAYQRWFYVALQRGERDKAFDIAELARRARFFASFPLGPRLFSLRMLFEGSGIDQQMLLERQTLSLDFARFGELSSQVAAVKKQLLMLPIVPKDQTQIDRQKKLLADLERLSLEQEAMLRPIALTRNKAPVAFPPVLKIAQIRAALPENTAMLVYFEALGKFYGFLVDRRSLSMWELLQGPRDPSLQKLIADFLESMGNRGANQALPYKELVRPDAKWKEAGAELQRRLLGGEQKQANFTELVIVPTGPLWYVPFEAMSVKIDGEYRPLISAGSSPLTVRYAPMASLGVPKKSSRSLTAETLVLYGKFQNKDKPEAALDAVDRYVKAGVRNLVPMAAIPNDPNFREFPGSASAFATQIKRLVVLDDIPASRTGDPLGWSPFNADKQKLNNPISSWLVLPWGGPQLLVLPGFHTAAETGLKTTGGTASKTITNGDDLFLSAMALEACGAGTILISRWRTGGRASYDLVGEFLKNHQTMSAAQAWRQAIIDVGVAPLELNEEPRVRSSVGDEPPLANHPFFWGAFLLIDCGETDEAAPTGSEGAPGGSKLD